jgi:radical SAM-linked protein
MEEYAMRIRIKFTKLGALKFIGHLDLMRTFQKIFRRSGIPIAYSEGFNPHQIFSIASPLAVGVTSEGEYADVKLTKVMDVGKLKELIDSTCPIGLEVLDVIALDDSEPAAMASVNAAKYIVSQTDKIINNDMIINFSKNEQIIIQKKNKKGVLKDLDIKPGIINMSLMNNNIIMTLATGSKLNIKPEFVLKALCEYSEEDYNKFDYKIHREDLYYIKNNNYIPLSISMVK